MELPTAMGMGYEAIKKLNDCRPCTFDTTRERWWYEIGLIDGAKAADIKNDDNRPITVDFLKKNFEDCSAAHRNVFGTTKKQTPISVDVLGLDGITWKVYIENDNNENKVYIKTIGQFKAFLRMFGLDEFANNLKG